jgi:hypothetical protein
MPEKQTLERAKRDKRQGKSASTQAGEFVREEMHHVREGKHGARSPEQAIAIGLSKARRAGVNLPPKKGGKPTAARQMKDGKSTPSQTRSRATSRALRREGRSAASPSSLGRHSRAAAARRSRQSRSASAKKAARTRNR